MQRTDQGAQTEALPLLDATALIVTSVSADGSVMDGELSAGPVGVTAKAMFLVRFIVGTKGDYFTSIIATW